MQCTLQYFKKLTKRELLSQTLRTRRRERKLTQEKTAELLGISTRWYQKIEKGTSEPNLTLICNIQKWFGLNLAKCAEEDACT